MARMQLSAAHRDLLNELYGKIKRTVDDLPYTDEFDWLYTEFIAASGARMSRHQVWTALTYCRKSAKLSRKVRNKRPPADAPSPAPA
jgi:hypothetical protein